MAYRGRRRRREQMGRGRSRRLTPTHPGTCNCDTIATGPGFICSVWTGTGFNNCAQGYEPSCGDPTAGCPCQCISSGANLPTPWR